MRTSDNEVDDGTAPLCVRNQLVAGEDTLATVLFATPWLSVVGGTMQS